MNTYTLIMNKDIAISDDVYRQLKREKGERSFSSERVQSSISLWNSPVEFPIFPRFVP